MNKTITKLIASGLILAAFPMPGIIEGWFPNSREHHEKLTDNAKKVGLRVPLNSNLYGDANCDGQITQIDATMIMQKALELSLMPRRTQEEKDAYSAGVVNHYWFDANADNTIDAADGTAVLQYLLVKDINGYYNVKGWR